MTIRKMRTTPKVTLTATGSDTQPCPCSSTSSDVEICCSLDCLVQPRFFCGQLLTDQDLTALLRWTQDKLRLARYRHGWGVVCGLEVHRHPDSGKSDHVIVGPGYAVSCCGDDIIVCEETPFNLGDACRREEAHCAELSSHGGAATGETECSIDLYIHYWEKESDPQTALGRSVCRQVAKCEYSRTRETFRLAWQPAVDGDPLGQVAEEWRKEYIAWLEEQADNLEPDKALLKIMQNYHKALNGGCYSCLKGHGVPLARVWLTPTEDQGWQVSVIDAYPPRRRPFMAESLIAPPGQVNLAPFLWHRWDNEFNHLRGILADLGLQVKRVSSKEADDAKTIVMAGNVFLPYHIPLEVYTTNISPLGSRVVGFGAIKQGKPPQKPGRPDRLTAIEGIGPKSEKALYAAGYYTYADLAAMKPDELGEVLPIRVSEKELVDIIRQAKRLAEEEK